MSHENIQVKIQFIKFDLFISLIPSSSQINELPWGYKKKKEIKIFMQAFM